jgi:hypothetical protein
MAKTLVFPSSMTESIDYSRHAKGRGECVLAASSMHLDETARYYDEWVYLPVIYDETFDERFVATVHDRGVTHFYTPHTLVYARVKKLVDQHDLDLSIVSGSPLDVLESHYRELLDRCREIQVFIEAIDSQCKLPALTLASIFYHSSQIYGQTNESKIAAMIAAFHSAPKGDVIEIGSAWGRSAFVLAFLANHYSIGNVLCIDPWSGSIASQKESPKEVDAGTNALDWEMMFRMFRIHLLGHDYGNINYLRTTSEAGQKIYSRSAAVKSEEFGESRYSRKIAVIHIDGNHDFEYAIQDYRLWRPYVIPGGWIILDDYVWAHGDGPRRVGDMMLEEEAAQIDRCFTTGSALFVRFRSL